MRSKIPPETNTAAQNVEIAPPETNTAAQTAEIAGQKYAHCIPRTRTTLMLYSALKRLVVSGSWRRAQFHHEPG